MKRRRKTIVGMLARIRVAAAAIVSLSATAHATPASGSAMCLPNSPGLKEVGFTWPSERNGAPLWARPDNIPANCSVGISASGDPRLGPFTRYCNLFTSDANAGSGTIAYRISDISTNSSERLDSSTVARRPGLSWETRSGKSRLIPALEIPGFIVLLNGYDRLTHGDDMEGGKRVYSTSLTTFWNHVVHGPWGFDQDSFATNQFMHPYQGSIYYGFARSAGLSYWGALGYTFAGSFLWETAGETTPPSINDQVASGIAGSFLGEPLFRMANVLLESGSGTGGFFRELGAATISPSTGFNRFAFGDRFKPVFPSHDPAIFQRLRLGLSLNAHVNDRTALGGLTRYLGTADYSMAYGLPGKPDYDYNRPFDYFNFEFVAVNSAANAFEDIMIRGLLLGKKYEGGASYRGAWGLYGSFDYISPHIFRVSSTAVSLGTTFQWWLAREVALQGSALGGIGYGAGGNVAGLGARDYHYGATGQGLLALRLILGEVATLDATGREYVISGLGATETDGSEHIARGNVALTLRIYHHHALGIQYLASSRHAHYSDRADSRQSVGTFGLVYTLLGDTRFGAVEWRAPESP